MITIAVVIDLKLDSTPVGSVEDAGRANVEEDNSVSGAEIVLYGPSDGVGALVA